jgi:PKD repeat protein
MKCLFRIGNLPGLLVPLLLTIIMSQTGAIVSAFLPANAQGRINIVILSPIPGSVISGSVPVFGATEHPQFAHYQLQYGTDPNPSNFWYPITDPIPTPVLNGLLGNWNTTSIPDGTYQLRLQVGLTDGSVVTIVSNNLQIRNTAPIPTATSPIQQSVAAFTANPSTGQAPLVVSFVNQSSGFIWSFNWNFGDGESSTEPNPVHTYAQSGRYLATLTINSPNGSSTTSHEIVVEGVAATPIPQYTVPVAQFTPESITGYAPFTARFINQSSGPITSYLWAFGDGTYSAEINPAHTYALPGAYGVTLTVSGPGGQNSVSSTIVVLEQPAATPVTPPAAAFVASPAVGNAPLLVRFTNQSTGSISSYTWDFGDGAVTNEANPEHTFIAAGLYPVRLTASGPGGQSFFQAVVQVNPPFATATPIPILAIPRPGIVFESNRTGNYEVFVMNADIFNPINLTNHARSDRYPVWSPDGTRIAFSSNRDDANHEIYVMNADGSNVVRLTYTVGMADFAPDWSPDGTRIAYTHGTDIYVMNADGSNPINLTAAGGGSHPAWSPDGTRIAFWAMRSDNIDIYVMNADGTGQTRLTTHAARDDGPSWSPDGTRIVYTNANDISVMNADGSNQTRLTATTADERYPVWSPDGRQIAFTRDDDLYVMNADGSNVVRLTQNADGNYYPDWQ